MGGLSGFVAGSAIKAISRSAGSKVVSSTAQRLNLNVSPWTILFGGASVGVITEKGVEKAYDKAYEYYMDKYGG